MSMFKKEFKIESRDVNMEAKLRPSAFLQFFQELAAEHAASLGYGYDYMQSKGLMWIIVKNHVIFHKLPSYGESVSLSTWTTGRRHALFPRFARMISACGEVLVDCASYFVVVDKKSRQAVFPENEGISISGEALGTEIALPGRIRAMEHTESAEFEVPYSYIDLNGHLNNVRYVDIAEDLLSVSERGRQVKELSIEYAHEALLHDILTVSWANEGPAYCINGSTDHTVFNMELIYD